MTDQQDEGLEAALSARVSHVEGVRHVFSGHPVSGVALSIVTGDPEKAAPRVEVDRSDGPVTVRARLALDRDQPTLQVLQAVLEEIDRQLDHRSARLLVEVAQID